MPQGPGPRSPEQALLMMRIIGISLGTGVTLFAGVAWLLHRQGASMEAAIDPAVALNGAVALALVAALGALFFWRSRVAPLLAQRPPEAEWLARATAIQTGVIVTWALIEGAALVAEVVYFLTGAGPAGLLGLVLIWGGIGLTWPKREWLGA